MKYLFLFSCGTHKEFLFTMCRAYYKLTMLTEKNVSIVYMSVFGTEKVNPDISMLMFFYFYFWDASKLFLFICFINGQLH